MYSWQTFVCMNFFFLHEIHYKQSSSLRNEYEVTNFGHIL